MTRWLAGLLLGGMSWFANAQFLNFDAVCAAPPCAIGSLYASSGVTFAPGNSSIVAAGTGGLTGPAGGHYLAIAAFPYQQTIALARQATFFAMQLSRANTSTGTVNVAVTWLKGGVPVNTINVVLTNVNTWVPVSATAAGGFDSIFIDPSGGANLTFGIDGLQVGGTCFGFSDVQPSDSFCNAAEWLGNRGVTLGCSPGQYCPTQNVARAQMALFMQRLGDALVPFTLRETGGSVGAYDSGTWSPACPTATIPAAPYPRVATVWSTSLLYPTAAPKQLYAKILYSTDEGTTWLQDGFYMRATTSTTAHITLPDNGRVMMDAGRAYRFAIGYLSAGATTVSIDCELVAHIDSVKSGASAPFDVAPARSQPQ